MRLALTIVVLVLDALVGLFLLSVIVFGRMELSGIIVAGVFIGQLGLNALAIIFCRRPRAASNTALATAHTFD